MKKRSISSKQEKLNQIYSLISELNTESEEKLVKFCLDNRHTLTDIARALGTTKSWLSQKYPHLREEKS